MPLILIGCYVVRIRRLNVLIVEKAEPVNVSLFRHSTTIFITNLLIFGVLRRRVISGSHCFKNKTGRVQLTISNELTPQEPAIQRQQLFF
jgi:hypothetical protein